MVTGGLLLDIVLFLNCGAGKKGGDFAFDDFSECNVCVSHAGTAIHESRATCGELFDALGYEVDELWWMGNDQGGLVNEFGFHNG